MTMRTPAMCSYYLLPIKAMFRAQKKATCVSLQKNLYKRHHYQCIGHQQNPFQPIPMLGPYSVSKTALFGLTKALSAEVCSSQLVLFQKMPGRNLVIDKEIVISTCFLQCFRQNKIIVKVASENIRVNCIAPGIIKTKFAEVILCPSSMVSSFLNFGQKWRII